VQWFLVFCPNSHCRLDCLAQCAYLQASAIPFIKGLLQASCSEQQVRQYLANLRSNLRSFIQRAQRNAAGKASGLPNGAPGAPAAQPQKSATGQPPLASHQHCGQCIVQPNTTLHDCTLYRSICMAQACHQAVQISASLGICV